MISSRLEIDCGVFTLLRLDNQCRIDVLGGPNVVVHYFAQGQGTFHGPSGEVQMLGASTLALVPPDLPHAVQSEGLPLRRFELELSREAPPRHELTASAEAPALVTYSGRAAIRYGGEMGLFERLRAPLFFELSEVSRIQAIFQSLHREQAGPGSASLRAGLFLQCLLHLFRRPPFEAIEAFQGIIALEAPRMAQVVSRIVEDPGSGHSVESLARMAFMSRSAFAKGFADVFGVPPMTFLHDIRLQAAARALRKEPTLSVEDVADRVGFSSRSHFSSAFKQRFGSSPREFRDRGRPLKALGMR